MPSALGLLGVGGPGVTDYTTGLLLWAKSDLGTFTDLGTTPAVNDGDLVRQWNDQSAALNNLLNAGGTARPLLKLNQVNGLPSVRFDGAANLLQALFTLDVPFHVMTVVRQIAWTNNATLCAGGANDNFSLSQSSATPDIVAWDGVGTFGLTNALALAAWGLVEVQLPAVGVGTEALVVNNAAIAGSGTSSLARGGITLGAHPGPSNFGNIEFAEFRLYPAVLAGANRKSAYNAMAARAGLTLIP